MPKCPRCESPNILIKGVRKEGDHSRRRLVCKKCGHIKTEAFLADDDLFPFGKYRQTHHTMQQVPARYLDRLMTATWIEEWPLVVKYVKENRIAIDMEIDE